MGEPTDITLGEVARRVDRLDQEMRAGFKAVQEEIAKLAFVPAAVYAADRAADVERIRRLEDDLKEEVGAREETERTAAQRTWQARLSLVMALIGLPLSVLGSVIVALVVVHIR